MPPIDIEGLTPEQQLLYDRVKAQARGIAGLLDRRLNPAMKHERDAARRTVGFALLVFPFGAPGNGATYISNAERASMIAVVEEWLAAMKAASS